MWALEVNALAGVAMADFDVAIIGGGINGAGIARASAYKGYRTLLLEKGDFAHATSSQSTKMIHGGIRYLETGDLHLVYESLRERSILLGIAPHLVKPLEIVIPAYRGSVRRPWVIRLGTILYDLLAGSRSLGRSRRLSREEAGAIPGLKQEGLRAAIAYHDAQAFDARLCLETALSARDAGAVVKNYHPVEKVQLHGGHYELEGRDLRSGGAAYRHTAKVVVNATGPWAPFLERKNLNHKTKPMVYDRGIHLVVPSIGLRQGLALMAGDRRLIFVLPWRGEYTLIGTTETSFEGEDFSHIPHSEEEVTYLLDVFNEFFPERGLGREEVLHVYSGVRTLIAGHDTALTRLSREAEIQVFGDGPDTAWLIVYGGKLTSYRALAEQAIRKLKRYLPEPPSAPLRTTERTPLYGGAEMVEIPAGKRPGFLTRELEEAWQERYGSNWVELVDMALAKPELQEYVLARFQFTRADLAYMVTMELAHTLEDVVLRRTTMIYSLKKGERELLARELERTQENPRNRPVYREMGT